MQKTYGEPQKHGYRDGSFGAGGDWSRATHATLSLFPRDEVFHPGHASGPPGYNLKIKRNLTGEDDLVD